MIDLSERRLHTDAGHFSSSSLRGRVLGVIDAVLFAERHEADFGDATQRSCRQLHANKAVKLRDPNPLALQIGQLTHAGLVVGVAHIISGERTLSG